MHTHFQVDFEHVDNTDENVLVSERRDLSVIPRKGEPVHFGGPEVYQVESVMWDFSRLAYPIILIGLINMLEPE